MRTSEQWWEETKANPAAMLSWLKDQYHGEVTAARRLNLLVPTVTDLTERALLSIIAEQEANHAKWVGKLLADRGVEPAILKKTSRYWEQTLPGKFLELPLKELAAIGAHAEKMRLERIRVIASDGAAPADIRAVFQAILPEEEFHEATFRDMAGTEALEAAVPRHRSGLNALGLIA